MKVIICGDRKEKSYEIVKLAISKGIQHLNIKITEVVCGDAQGADLLGERWARENNIPVKHFPADWKNLNQPDAIINVNDWGGYYNANAGFYRNQQMVDYADACIAIQSLGPTNGTQSTIKMAKKKKMPLYVFTPNDRNDHEYIF